MIDARRLLQQTRRHFFGQCGLGLGSMALASLLGEGRSASAADATYNDPAAPRPGHFPARAKSVIYLFMAGGPSQFELFEHKPKLQGILRASRSPSRSSRGDGSRSWTRSRRILPSCSAPRGSSPVSGESGAWVSECLPHLAGVVDDLTIIRSVATDVFNHAPAKLFANTGTTQFGRPSMGSWVTYGWAVSRVTCLVSSCCSRVRGVREAGPSIGAVDSCRRSIKGAAPVGWGSRFSTWLAPGR